MNFPRTLQHEGLTGAGSPLIVSSKLDPAIVEKIARHSFWCCQPGYLWSNQRFALDAIRQKSPDLKILVHFVAHSFWGAPSDLRDNYQGRLAVICTQANGVYPGTRTPNLVDNAIRGAILDLWSEVLEAGGYDGVMLDPMCAVDGCGPLDAQRAALGSILSTLRRRHPSAIIIGCGGPGMAYPGASSANGWWLEGWPDQNPVGWGPVTRLCMDASHYYTAPHFNVIAMARTSVDPQAMRFGLGTSCLFDGVFAYGPPDWKGSAHLDWRIPEAEPQGWLGRPIGAPWPSFAGSVWERKFENGSVLVDTMKKDAAFTRR